MAKSWFDDRKDTEDTEKRNYIKENRPGSNPLIGQDSNIKALSEGFPDQREDPARIVPPGKQVDEAEAEAYRERMRQNTAMPPQPDGQDHRQSAYGQTPDPFEGEPTADDLMKKYGKKGEDEKYAAWKAKFEAEQKAKKDGRKKFAVKYADD